jgi:hypothetical protein
MEPCIDTLEATRLALQSSFDSARTKKERNHLGQIATPSVLARDILTYGLELLPSQTSVRFLDPAIGTGAFFSALLSTESCRTVEAADGYEVDPQYEVPVRHLWSATPLRLHIADFTRVSPPDTETERFNFVVCNPPYVRHHHLPNTEKVRLQPITEAVFGVPVGGLAGLYCYFLALAHLWMRTGAIACWLIPSEFMTVKYGYAVKRYLLNRVTLVRIHRFDPHDVQFDDVLVSSAVVFFRNAPPPPNHSVEFTYSGAVGRPEVSRCVSAEALCRETKWTRFPVAGTRDTSSSTTLGDYFHIKRGLVTGSNQFFILTPEQIEQQGLPWEWFRPILPSPRYLECDEVIGDKDGNPMLTQQLFLLDCRLPEEEVKTVSPVLWSYIETGIPEVSHRYLCRHRTPWYRQEERPHTPFVCTYIGRRNTKRGVPFRFIFNQSRATVPNVYLMLYPKPTLAQALQVEPTLAREVWRLLLNIQPDALLDEGRVYGGGVHKLEPSELSKVPLVGMHVLLSGKVQEIDTC